ncbi:lipocalin family protein [Tenacibaculum sp. 47A_GOM-205m]|uniref:lipocalin family protein n=1 Tax=Tenacibaculum sp. 47A_GOM-205m TaxID=1380384 RepID=UPI00048EAE40|nr:lipocalin family protein [Tenacibaculum sp. 47A_GOM-205m]
MKKILVLSIIISSVLHSCSSNSEIVDNSIVGNWNLKFIHDETGEIPIPYCRTLTSFSFKEDKTYNAQIYNMGESTIDCVLTEEITGTWKALGNSSFELSNKNHITFKVNSIELRENKNSTKYQILLPN